MSMVTKRVPRKVIRPLPPSMDGMVYWSPSDIVEVLEIYSWKVALVLSVAAGDCYFVKILGSSKDIIAHQSELRVSQAWKDNHWVIIQQDTTGFKEYGNMVRRSIVEEEVNSPIPQHSQELKNYQVGGQVPYKDHFSFEEGQRKRRHIHSTPLKLRTHDWDHTEYNDARSVSSSIGSCSPCGGPCRPYCNPTAYPTQDMDSLLSTVDAYCRVIRKLYSAKKDERVGKFHHLELHAYNRALKKLNSYGALTWKQEAYLTNLRVALHISNDEHQKELKHLAST